MTGTKQRLSRRLHGVGILDLRKSKLELSDDNAAAHFTELSDEQRYASPGHLALLKGSGDRNKSAEYQIR